MTTATAGKPKRMIVTYYVTMKAAGLSLTGRVAVVGGRAQLR